MEEFDPIIGYSDIKAQLERTATILRHIAECKAAGAKLPSGLLLSGEPGVGKTLMANCLIKASGLPCFTIRRDKATNAFIDTINMTFTHAAAQAPSIVYLDDMDKFANADEQHRNAPEYVAVQSCIDAAKGSDVFVLATANELNCLPRSLLRPGRFDKHINVRVPEGNDAKAIIRHYLDAKPLADDISFDDVAMLMWHDSCAKLEGIINEALLISYTKDEEAISRDSFMEAYFTVSLSHIPVADEDEEIIIRGRRFTPEGTASDTAEGLPVSAEERHRIAVHEAGHAAVNEIMRAGTISLVTAFRKGDARGGTCTTYRPEHVTPSEWGRLEILCGLGGLAASDLVFGIHDTGALDDLEKVRDMVQRRVEEYGCSGLGLLRTGYPSSSDLVAKIEDAIAIELERQFRRAKQILAANRGFLDALTAAVETNDYLLASDIAAIRAKFDIMPFEL